MSEEKSTIPDNSGGPTYLGDGKFQFKSQGAACYMHPLGWVSDREDGKGIAMCLVTDAERRMAEFQLASVMPMPFYTPAMATAGSNALLADGILALNRALGAIQLSIAGEGVLTGALSAVAGAIARAVAALATAAVANAGPIAATAVLSMWPMPAGQGSDKWNGQNLALLTFPLSTLTGKQTVLPGKSSIELPVRGSLVMNGDHLEFNLLKTGDSLSKVVPVLNAVRDAVTGLDSIIIPGIDGAPDRTILINPVPTGPLAPPHTGNSSPVPVTPVNTGTTIEPINKPVITPTPAPEQMFDFIYWQLDAKGSGVEPVYVVTSNPIDTRQHQRVSELVKIFDKTNPTSSLIVEGKVIKQGPEGNRYGTTKVYEGQGLTDQQIHKYVQELTGNKKLIEVKPGIYRAILTDGTAITLRNVSTSEAKTGSRWTVDIRNNPVIKQLGNKYIRVEIKFK